MCSNGESTIPLEKRNNMSRRAQNRKRLSSESIPRY